MSFLHARVPMSTLSWRGADVGRLSCPQFSHPVHNSAPISPWSGQRRSYSRRQPRRSGADL